VSTVPERVAALAAQLAASGDLNSGRWHRALRDVPRHLFIPNLALAAPADSEIPYLINREEAPETWWNAVYSDTAIVTQLDDGATDLAVGTGDYTCSSSAPGVVIEFLELLDVYDFDEILEIGTGTGWTAALLSSQLDEKNVTTIEIDPQVAADAGKSLEAAGYRPHIITGDGADGWPSEAPYDSVHVTCGVADIPYSWVEQTRPGGFIVLPWIPGYGPGHKVRLRAAGDVAIGRFHGGSTYMMMRAQRRGLPHIEGRPRSSTTYLDPRRVTQSSWGADIAITGMLPGVSSQENDTTDQKDGTYDFWLWDGQSSAHVVYSPDYKQPTVEQRGPRDLWNETEAAYLEWIKWGSPGRDRFGMTVTPDGQHIWLDSPDHVVSPASVTAHAPRSHPPKPATRKGPAVG
jgi:protein-L-isoaspartate(D-aspartate) O-methyltransferase